MEHLLDLSRRRALAGMAAICAMTAFSRGAEAQSGQMRIIFPFAAGGSGDALSRLAAERLSAVLSVPALVDNRTGAAGRIGVRAVATAAADGTTLLAAPSPVMAIYPHSYESLGYDPAKDFEPVAGLAAFDIALAVASNLPARTVPELIAWIRANPANATYGSPGAGGLGHLGAVMFAQAARLELKHVSYRGSAPLVTDLTGGHVPMAVMPVSDLAELHKAGRARVLATAGPQRSSFLPDVPTLREAGLDVLGRGWFGLYAPAATPAETLARLSRTLTSELARPELQERIRQLGLEPLAAGPQELRALQAADLERWGPVVRASGFRPEQ